MEILNHQLLWRYQYTKMRKMFYHLVGLRFFCGEIAVLLLPRLVHENLITHDPFFISIAIPTPYLDGGLSI